ncbi:uncharacterized protein LOC126690125 [Quercus robur]|uniref:uncharacterized protein LOC126690125 n=1 Tax=Quercus robur TaxID=38942 RepID=UPI0021639DA4|nr:uncharacterized protein LOC126690125 [Quercus robur]
MTGLRDHVTTDAWIGSSAPEEAHIYICMDNIMSLFKEDHISSPPSASQLQFCSPNFFRCLDRNQDDSLDFWEVLTLYYIMKTRGVWCKSCGVCQLGLYFTCVACFDNASHTYDLCTNCYSQRRYSHHHVSFLDSYMLLRSKRGLPLGAPNLNQNSQRARVGNLLDELDC